MSVGDGVDGAVLGVGRPLVGSGFGRSRRGGREVAVLGAGGRGLQPRGGTGRGRGVAVSLSRAVRLGVTTVEGAAGLVGAAAAGASPRAGFGWPPVSADAAACPAAVSSRPAATATAPMVSDSLRRGGAA
ncbi:hypothetical protein [Thermomonospora cellulosilytica]|uniref:Uncharacterized protein n=1 Tax=Thermomonospora cellulosilytica TaxID=1411118 RepID=A0A7W3RB67_9ACTN|nr:hypothetical protein [Thermomonospora cellulosilytica]MBA9006000.1 hypothetical protein [Thermomonospora cellulosilytica]